MRLTYWSTDDGVKKLLEYRPSIEDMKLILEPICYLFIGSAVNLAEQLFGRVIKLAGESNVAVKCNNGKIRVCLIS
jgi:hypothetical protein